MQFTVDHQAMQTAQGIVSRSAQELDTERSRLSASVEGFLGAGWSGQAADEYRQAWQEWLDGAAEVLSALHAEAQLLGMTDSDYAVSDESSQQRTSPIGSRLQERLS